MKEVLNIIFNVEMTYQIWTSLEEQLLPTIVEKEGHLKNMLMILIKGYSKSLEYLEEFKFICD